MVLTVELLHIWNLELGNYDTWGGGMAFMVNMECMDGVQVL